MWESTYPTNLKRIIRVVCCINKDAYDAHTDPIFNERCILKFIDIYLLNLCKFTYSYQNGLHSTNFDDCFIKVNQAHHYNTRSANNIYTRFC